MVAWTRLVIEDLGRRALNRVCLLKVSPAGFDGLGEACVFVCRWEGLVERGDPWSCVYCLGKGPGPSGSQSRP